MDLNTSHLLVTCNYTNLVQTSFLNPRLWSYLPTQYLHKESSYHKTQEPKTELLISTPSHSSKPTYISWSPPFLNNQRQVQTCSLLRPEALEWTLMTRSLSYTTWLEIYPEFDHSSLCCRHHFNLKLPFLFFFFGMDYHNSLRTAPQFPPLSLFIFS